MCAGLIGYYNKHFQAGTPLGSSQISIGEITIGGRFFQVPPLLPDSILAAGTELNSPAIQSWVMARQTIRFLVCFLVPDVWEKTKHWSWKAHSSDNGSWIGMMDISTRLMFLEWVAQLIYFFWEYTEHARMLFQPLVLSEIWLLFSNCFGSLVSAFFRLFFPFSCLMIHISLIDQPCFVALSFPVA